MTNYMLIINAICTCVLAVILIVAFTKGWITTGTIEGIATIIDSFTDSGNGIIDDLTKYAALAVRTVEQMVKTGAIKKENETRQKAAVDIVKSMVSVDYDVYVANEINDSTIAAIVDAEVSKLPRNQ